MERYIELSYKRKLHFIGVGGIGMSALAQILLQQGHRVSGSDIDCKSVTVEHTRKLGGVIFQGHRAENINGADLVVYSSCIRPDNPEILQARAKGLQVVPRAVVLAGLMRDRISIAIAGTHGKTTTTSLMGLIISRAGWKPSVVIGGLVDDFCGNACLGQGQYLVAEADESDGSFLYLNQNHALVTNIEAEHMDYYCNMDQVLGTYRQFINNCADDGYFAGCLEDKNIVLLHKETDKKFIGYGFSRRADIYPERIKLDELGSEFDVVYKQEKLGGIKLQIPGRHNVLNSLGAAGLGLSLGIKFPVIQEALFSYHGARRRFEIKWNTPGCMVIDDYAHHPTEIRATIAAARNNFKGRLIGIFQPHRYTRTKLLDKLFGPCFDGVDKLILTDIYPAGELPLEGVTGENIYRTVKAHGHKDVFYLPDKNEIIPHVLEIIKPGDRLLIMGAGNITKTADDLVEKIKRKPGQ